MPRNIFLSRRPARAEVAVVAYLAVSSAAEVVQEAALGHGRASLSRCRHSPDCIIALDILLEAKASASSS